MGRAQPLDDLHGADEDGSIQETLVRDERPLAVRRYDGFMGVVRAGAGATDAGPATNLVVTATVKRVAGFRDAGTACLDRVGPIGAGVFGYLTCSATLTRVLTDARGVPVDVGRAHRLAPPALRKVLAVRDGGCVIPGCTVPAAGCDAHHVVFWSRAGPTDLDNMSLLCGHHHQQVHADIWQIKISDGVPWVRPPAWVDPHRRLRRHPLHDNGSAVHRLAEQLTLALEDEAA